jgi:hypothetical protein
MARKNVLVDQREVDPVMREDDTALVGAAIDTISSPTLTIGGTATSVVVNGDFEVTGSTTISGPVIPTDLPLEFAIDGVDTTTNVTADNLSALAGGTFPGMIQFREVTIGHADLVDAALFQGFNLGAVLPANALIMGVSDGGGFVPFSGGGAGVVTVDVGTAGDPNALRAGGDLFAAAVDGQISSMPNGIAPNRLYVAAGAQLRVTITSDVNVDLLDAGSVKLIVSFVTLP